MHSVSIVFAVKDRKKLLERCLYTWSKQTYPFEFILVDDGSTEDVLSVAKLNFPDTKYVRLENMRDRTPAVAWDEGFKQADGDFVIFTNGDLILSGNDVIQDILETYDENRVRISVLTYFLSQDQTKGLDTIDWKTDPRVLETFPGFWDYVAYNQSTSNSRNLSAGLTTYITAQSKADWEWFGMFRTDDYHLGCDQDLHLREAVLGRYCQTAKRSVAYHQWHPAPRVAMGKSYKYETERQARLLDPAEREK